MIARPSPLPSISVSTPRDARDVEILRGLFLEYARSLGVDLGFQNFEQELRDLPGDYAAPRGLLLLAWVDGQAAGCSALRPLDTADYANACEMKRLYVRPPFRKLGLGRRLSEATLDAARVQGYDHVLLDTLDDMEAARALYEDLGFVDIPPYYHNPIAGAHYLLATLSSPRK
ncbi:GNAT family N-acetyltransferase [Hylemonella gracilis]|uniref:GCN5-like N-acetyltransferase n=1 Tax=Hylemonella gracilis ATCC 19624 TaxID=887062 RepID=F3KQN1_9BURK|nr:GNAT family N-acetyltransferase [Hylemonella gracilis]EGI77905.1 GCN5-like N-acetyltransferase [Hylemonella gracilis ATCC 19624]